MTALKCICTSPWTITPGCPKCEAPEEIAAHKRRGHMSAMHFDACEICNPPKKEALTSNVRTLLYNVASSYGQDGPCWCADRRERDVSESLGSWAAHTHSHACIAARAFLDSKPVETTEKPVDTSWLDTRQFYELMQGYRHADPLKPAEVVEAFETVKRQIREWLAVKSSGEPK